MKNPDHYFSLLIENVKKTKEPFYTILVNQNTGEVVAEGTNRSSKDPTSHSEIEAIRNFAAKYPNQNRQDLVMYTTAEPCPMCAAAIVYADIPHVVYGIERLELVRRGWNELTLGASDIFQNAQSSSGQVYSISPYQGAHLETCKSFFYLNKV